MAKNPGGTAYGINGFDPFGTYSANDVLGPTVAMFGAGSEAGLAAINAVIIQRGVPSLTLGDQTYYAAPPGSNAPLLSPPEVVNRVQPLPVATPDTTITPAVGNTTTTTTTPANTSNAGKVAIVIGLLAGFILLASARKKKR